MAILSFEKLYFGAAKTLGSCRELNVAIFISKLRAISLRRIVVSFFQSKNASSHSSRIEGFKFGILVAKFFDKRFRDPEREISGFWPDERGYRLYREWNVFVVCWACRDGHDELCHKS
jgi:hypothetical protein